MGKAKDGSNLLDQSQLLFLGEVRIRCPDDFAALGIAFAAIDPHTASNQLMIHIANPADQAVETPLPATPARMCVRRSSRRVSWLFISGSGGAPRTLPYTLPKRYRMVLCLYKLLILFGELARVYGNTNSCVPFDTAPATNAALPTREDLAQHEVEKLIEVVKRNRHGRRDAF
jgi:hypothetical protein